MEKKDYSVPPMTPRTASTPVVAATPGTPALTGTPGAPQTASTPGTPILAGTPGGSAAMPSDSSPSTGEGEGKGGPAGKMPPMPSFPKMQNSTNMQNTTNFQATTKMPNVSMDQFKMSEFFEMQMEHHRTHHLEPNGDCKPHLKEEGWKYYMKYRG